MLKLIWLSDTHFASGSTMVLGHDPRASIDAAIQHINDHHADADYCIISGDLVERGIASEYQAFKSHLDNLIVPYLPMVGNHDDRDALRSILPLPDSLSNIFIQYDVYTEFGSIVCLDTTKVGSGSGEYCEARFDWLHRVLTARKSAPAYIFMHHPPFSLGLPMQDTEQMENGAEFLEFLNRYSNVRHLFMGHVHRPVCGQVAGLPFATMRSTLYQAPAPRPEWTWDSFAPVDEAPCLGIVMIDTDSVIVQYTNFGPFP